MRDGKKIKFLYNFGADEGIIKRKDLSDNAFIVYQGEFSFFNAVYLLERDFCVVYLCYRLDT